MKIIPASIRYFWKGTEKKEIKEEVTIPACDCIESDYRDPAGSKI